MAEIIYNWQGGSAAVAVADDVQLPQFDVVGYRQTSRVISLTTGQKVKLSLWIINGDQLFWYWMMGWCRQLFSSWLGDPICSLDGLLPDSDLHPIGSDCNHLLGVVLAQPSSDTSSCLPRRHHCAHHDDTHVVHQRCLAKDFLRQIHRHLSRHLFRHGFCFSSRQVPLCPFHFHLMISLSSHSRHLI